MTKDQVLFWMESFEIAAEMDRQPLLGRSLRNRLLPLAPKAVIFESLGSLAVDSRGSMQETGEGAVQKTADQTLRSQRSTQAE